MELVLASWSPPRREYLPLLGLPFTVDCPKVDENQITGNDPAKRAMDTAALKARAVAQHRRCGIVIGADTVVAVNGELLGKPRDEADAVRMLQRLSGTSHQVYTGVCAIDVDKGQERRDAECTTVTMAPLTHTQILAYVQTGEPMDKAGAYGIQGVGSVLIERINGCYFNVLGLPLHRLSHLLKDLGVGGLL